MPPERQGGVFFYLSDKSVDVGDGGVFRADRLAEARDDIAVAVVKPVRKLLEVLHDQHRSEVEGRRDIGCKNMHYLC